MAGGLGFALGGAAQSFQQGMRDNSTAEFRQQELQLQQQAQQNAKERDIFARNDRAREELWGVISTTVNHGIDAGHDPQTIAQSVQPLMQPLKRLARSSGVADADATYDAMLAASIAKPSAFDVLGGRSAPARSPGAGGGARGVDLPPPVGTENSMYEARPQSPGDSGPTPGARGRAAAPADDVDKLTRAMAVADNPGLQKALGARLQEALSQRGDDTTVHFLGEKGSETPVFVSARGRTVTDINGRPYVAPTGDDSDTKRIADAIQSGRQPPSTTGLYKQAKGVKAELERRNFDLTQANLEWQSAQSQVKNLNSQRMIQYVSLAKSVDNTIDELKSLSEQMDQSGIPLLNRANLVRLTQTEGNSERGQLAAKYLAAANGLKEEMANLENGGYAPTESAWFLAKQQVNEDYGVKQLGASVTEVQRLIRYRINAIPNLNTLGPGGANRYTPGGGAGGAGGGGQPEKPSDDGWTVKRVQ